MKEVKPKPEPSSEITLRLHEPGMSPLHRAGLGGLAATLFRLEKEVKKQTWSEEKAPGWPWKRDDVGSLVPPWSVRGNEVILRFGSPEQAGTFLESLFSYSFRIRDQLIFLPGAYGELSPSVSVRAHLQESLMCTFLQHGQSRDLKKEAVSVSGQADEAHLIPVSYKPCSWFKHQDVWKEIVSKKSGCLSADPVDISGPLYPGASVRHVAHSAQTGVAETWSTYLPLCFALVGALSLSIRNRVGILVVPEVVDLKLFSRYRHSLTPMKIRECQIDGMSDAVLQAYTRLWATEIKNMADLPGCRTYALTVLAWSKQQRSRSRGLEILPGDHIWLEQFQTALAQFPPRLVFKDDSKNNKGKILKLKSAEESFSFWSDSTLRPFIAENLALHHPWYFGFSKLMVERDDNNKPLREKIKFEKKGLQQMIEQIQWKNASEEVLIQAVHQALRCRYGQIADESKGKGGDALNNRFDREYDKWRIAFAGSKTPDQFRTSLCDLFSRAGNNSVLAQNWRTILPLLTQKDWQLARDLALLALASYSKPTSATPETPATT